MRTWQRIRRFVRWLLAREDLGALSAPSDAGGAGNVGFVAKLFARETLPHDDRFAAPPSRDGFWQMIWRAERLQDLPLRRAERTGDGAHVGFWGFLFGCERLDGAGGAEPAESEDT